MKENERKVINNAIEFIASIMDTVDCDIEIADGFTIADGWNEFVKPLCEIID